MGVFGLTFAIEEIYPHFLDAVKLMCKVVSICRRFSCKTLLRQPLAEAAPGTIHDINSLPVYVDHEPKVGDRGKCNRMV